jgi:hypothetical protein
VRARARCRHTHVSETSPPHLKRRLPATDRAAAAGDHISVVVVVDGRERLPSRRTVSEDACLDYGRSSIQEAADQGAEAYWAPVPIADGARDE